MRRIGVAWTPVGGDLRLMEVTVARGKGHVKTGKAGKQLAGTAEAAVAYVRSHAAEAEALGVGEPVIRSCRP